MSWLAMFKVLSSFSASISLGLAVKDWNFSGLASRKLFLYQNDVKWHVFWASILQSHDIDNLHQYTSSAECRVLEELGIEGTCFHSSFF